jgi:starvation-inducible DNA-binding protein
MTVDLTAQVHRGDPSDPMARNEGVADLLQPVVADLIALALYAKNAHWNVSGPGFRSAHLALDELVATTLLVTDSVAERLKALGLPVDGSPQAVATRADVLVPVVCPAGSTVTDTLSWVASLVDDVTTSIRRAAGRVGQTDAPTGDLLNTITLDLEKQKWLLRSEL